MKKFLTVLLVLVVAMGFVFANEAVDQTHSLTLKTTVASDLAAHWASATTSIPSSASDWTSFTSIDGTEVGIDFSKSGKQDVGVFGYKTNSTTLAKFSIEGTSFEASGTDAPTTTVGYDIYNGDSKIVASGASAVGFITESSANGGKLRFGGVEISILLGPEATTAGAGSYTATLKVTTKAI